MPYKDKEQKKVNNAERQRRYREKERALRDRRGLDIRKFEHLPIDVQRTINRLSDDEQEHAGRAAIAISYQHQFPHRYHNTGVALSEHGFKDKVYGKEAVIFNEGVKAKWE